MPVNASLKHSARSPRLTSPDHNAAFNPFIAGTRFPPSAGSKPRRLRTDLPPLMLESDNHHPLASS